MRDPSGGSLCIHAFMKLRVRVGWLAAAVTTALISATVLFGFGTGSCQDSADAASSICAQGTDPVAVMFALIGERSSYSPSCVRFVTNRP